MFDHLLFTRGPHEEENPEVDARPRKIEDAARELHEENEAEHQFFDAWRQWRQSHDAAILWRHRFHGDFGMRVRS